MLRATWVVDSVLAVIANSSQSATSSHRVHQSSNAMFLTTLDILPSVILSLVWFGLSKRHDKINEIVSHCHRAC